MKRLLVSAYEDYLRHMSSVIPNYDGPNGHESRRKQCKTFINAINDNFNFDRIITLETGASSSYDDGLFGLFLGYLTQKTNGKMISVDISSETADKSRTIFKNAIPELDYLVTVEDSVSFLKNIEEIPNLVHLDSMDFNLLNILPSALHGWEEFKAIESKMEKGSIIIIDDNYPKDTNVQWVYNHGGIERMRVIYPMIGKGAHVYQHVLNSVTDWELIGTHYDNHDNIKIIIQKK